MKYEGPNRVKRPVEHWQLINVFLVLYDIAAVNLAFLLALWLRFDCRMSQIPENYLMAFVKFAPIYTVVCLLVFWRCRLYSSIWRFASFSEFVSVVFATAVTFAVQCVGITLLFERMPATYYIVGILLQAIAVLFIRFSYRFVLLLRDNRPAQALHRIMIIGAGVAGQMLIRDIQRVKKGEDKICCIIDDNPNKWGRFVEGVPVTGGRDSILQQVQEHQIDRIYLAIPSATAEQRRDILNICNETECELKQLPGLYQMVSGEVTVGAMRDVSVEDLLGREPVQVSMAEVFGFVTGKTILVTGGGGSIGSELCRQIAGHRPKRLIIFDVYENNAYDIQLELRKNFPGLDLITLIGSVRDSGRIMQVFREYRPDVVYHAAAHKHVPLMEDSPREAIKNNVFGTYKTAYAAVMNGCQRFVLISTDKAVNPTNVMGASKRMCEMVIQAFDRMVKDGRAGEIPLLHAHMNDEDASMLPAPVGTIPARTEFVAVRFGNVLGSNGSVVPIFKKQIAAGGPVTVSHPDIIRYFMTIPEAVSLVLQAGVYAQGGEIFVLDMGSPVKIDTLARNLIRLSGLRPDVDIKIEYTGLRPGEKLYEELLMAEEGMRTTPNQKIHIGSPIPLDVDEFFGQLKRMMAACYNEEGDFLTLLREIVPTYHPKDRA